MAEEEVAAETEKLVRGLMMAAGQLREHFARRRANQDRATADQQRAEAEQAAAQFRTQHEATQHLYQRVQRNSFWNTADSGTIADLASYGALNAHLDPTAGELYQLVREKVAERYGIDVNALRTQNPNSEEARNDALRHAIDDQRAAARDDAAADADREKEAKLEETEQATAETDPSTSAEAGEAAEDAQAEAEEHEDDQAAHREHAAGDYAQAHELEQRGDAIGVSPVPTSMTGRASREASVSYPHDAQSTLEGSAGKRQPRPSRQRKRASEKTSELSK